MRPNFAFILAADLGYADLGSYGGRTPCSPGSTAWRSTIVRFTEDTDAP